MSGEEAAVAAPAAIAERGVEVAGLLVHLCERGEGERLVVLHHSTGPLWGPLHDELAGRFAVTAPDMPGYGKSTRPLSARHPSHLAVLLNQLLGLERADRVHLVGLGLGGWVAAEMAASSQERLASLTLVGAAGIRPREGFIHDPMAEGWIAYAQRGFADRARFAEVFGERPAQDVVDVWDYSREMTARVTWRPWMWSLQLPDLLRGVRTRTLVAWGERDEIVPVDCAHQYVEALPDARLAVVAGAGHALDLERPAELAGLIFDFAGVS
jgi:pimeloyl-ACP methyl ester carboxylesterase